MFYLALGCGMFAVALASLFTAYFLKRLYAKTKPDVLRDTFHDQSISTYRVYPLLWKVTALLGYPLSTFVTWEQRRRLCLHIERAGLKGWDFFQVYCLQFFCAIFALVLLGWWHLASLFSWQVGAYFYLFSAVLFAWWLPILWIKREQRLRLRLISRQLPFFLDMVGLGLDAGLNLQAAVQLALDHIGPGALHEEWSKMLAEMRAGQSRAQALRQLSRRLDLSSVRQLISSLIQGESMGFSLGRIIEIYADQQRALRLMQAEKQALQAPVKMLFPMALCIFPCTFIVLGFPVVVQLFGLQ